MDKLTVMQIKEKIQQDFGVEPQGRTKKQLVDYYNQLLAEKNPDFKPASVAQDEKERSDEEAQEVEPEPKPLPVAPAAAVSPVVAKSQSTPGSPYLPKDDYRRYVGPYSQPAKKSSKKWPIFAVTCLVAAAGCAAFFLRK